MITGKNLPPGVNINDPDAPWNQRQPDPDGVCPHCELGYFYKDRGKEIFEVDLTTSIVICTCPSCGNPIHASKHEFTKGFLLFVRDDPKKALDRVDNYSELRGVTK